MLVLGLSFGGFFIIIAKTSFIYIEYFKISTDLFPLFFGINFVVLIAMIKVNINLLTKQTPLQLVKKAIIIQIITALLFALSYEDITILRTVVLIACYLSMMAFIFGNCMALALEYFSKNAGVASGVIGVLQFGLGALVSSIALNFHDGTFLPIALSTLLISILAFMVINLKREDV